MKLKFRMYRRGRIYYVEDNETGQQESLKTSDKAVATRLWNAKNESSILATSNLQVARAYMVASDPHMPKRTWKEVVDFIIGQKTGVNKHRWTVSGSTGARLTTEVGARGGLDSPSSPTRFPVGGE